MPQVFSRTSNTMVKVSFLGGGLLIASLFLFGSSLSQSPYKTRATVPPHQPVPFSHKHHVNELGIDCRYCHSSVEESSFAGLPPTQTCMSCHSQIWTNSPLLEPIRESYNTDTPIKDMNTGDYGWMRVAEVPDFVYFNHSIHIKKGVSCYYCHGQVNEMPLMYKAKPFNMVWCLDCHRAPEKYIRPREEIFNPNYQPKGDQLEIGKQLVKEYHINKAQLTNCSICHR